MEDTGIGVSPERIADIGTPGFSQKPEGFKGKYVGTGLGLSSVRKSVERCEGLFDIQSQLGQGSCFTLRLPFQKFSEKKHNIFLNVEKTAAELEGVYSVFKKDRVRTFMQLLEPLKLKDRDEQIRDEKIPNVEVVYHGCKSADQTTLLRILDKGLKENQTGMNLHGVGVYTTRRPAYIIQDNYYGHLTNRVILKTLF